MDWLIERIMNKVKLNLQRRAASRVRRNSGVSLRSWRRLPVASPAVGGYRARRVGFEDRDRWTGVGSLLYKRRSRRAPR